MMVIAAGYDKKILNHRMLLDLPFNEGAGTTTRDCASPHHQDIDLINTPTWASIASGLGVIQLDGVDQYLECPAANTVDLNFTTGDYSIVGWINYQILATSQIVIGRYGVDLDGWELYLYSVNNTLSLRHHHSSLAPPRTGCYSEGWATNIWHLFGISRSGLYPTMYRNGFEVEVAYDIGGLQDPDTCNRDLVIGTRYTKGSNWYKGMMANMRILGKALTLEDHRFIFETERHWFRL